ncbi:MAG TPA: thioredoxin family protein, partial [Chthoniobacterales bacterium]
MKRFRSVLLLFMALVCVASASASSKPGWLTDLKEAQEQAKSGNKLLLLDFTGSDWCGWCIKLDREVFSKPEFKAYAEKNLVLLELDFPRGRELTP